MMQSKSRLMHGLHGQRRLFGKHVSISVFIMICYSANTCLNLQQCMSVPRQSVARLMHSLLTYQSIAGMYPRSGRNGLQAFFAINVARRRGDVPHRRCRSLAREQPTLRQPSHLVCNTTARCDEQGPTRASPMNCCPKHQVLDNLRRIDHCSV